VSLEILQVLEIATVSVAGVWLCVCVHHLQMIRQFHMQQLEMRALTEQVRGKAKGCSSWAHYEERQAAGDLA
jgi:hypothetical protein